MNAEFFKQFADIPVREIQPGFFSKIIHTKANTIAFLEVKAGCAIKSHQHVEEQYSFVIEGQFELTVDGNPQVLDANTFAIIPSNVFHSGRAVTDCKLLDIFSPVRMAFKYD